MSSFLFTTIAAVVGVVVLAPSYATNIPTTNPGCTTTVLGADNVANGSAALEPDFSANTINTTWYSNGTQLTGNNIPATCTYDYALTPPTPEDRPGYTFGGWKVKAACEIPSNLASNSANSNGYINDSTGPRGATSFNPSEVNLTEDNTWGAKWSTGIVRGVAFCSITRNGKAKGEIGDPGTTGGYAAGGKYCWCKATDYKANGEPQCSLVSASWVMADTEAAVVTAESCADMCAAMCASYVRKQADFRAAVFTGLVAQ